MKLETLVDKRKIGSFREGGKYGRANTRYYTECVSCIQQSESIVKKTQA